MYDIIFYQDSSGKSELLELIKELDKKAIASKSERVMLKQIRFHINILEMNGTRAGEPYVKHVQDEIWEIRPGNNRILFFTWIENRIVLLHQFRKTTKKTPTAEIEKAHREVLDWKERDDK